MTPALILAVLLPGAQWTPLFDGKSLDGWHQLGGKANYAVKGDSIVGSTVPGTPNSFLCTDKVYGDFELEYEVFIDPQLNSGVQIRSMSVPGYKDGVVHGYQIEIDPTQRGYSGGLYDESRRGWLQDTSKNPAAQKAFRNGKWNKFKVAAKGDHLQSWVNGVPVTDYHDSLTRTGFIALQVHNFDKAGAEVKWRNIKIKDLGIPTAKPPKGGQWLLHEASDLKNWEPNGKPGEPCPWKWVDGALQIEPGAGDIASKGKYSDFKLHFEFNVSDNGKTGQANGNSGLYLMQSYEIQVLNSAPRGPDKYECASIYSIKAPDYAMALPAGVWQSYDLIFTAAKWNGTQKAADARLTLYHNGTMVHNDVAIPGPTGAGAPESATPRSFRIQDHGNVIRYRNIWIAP